MDNEFLILFWVLFAAISIWFILIIRFVKVLEKEHPEKYEAMGKPLSLWSNPAKTTLEFMKLIFKREYLLLKNQKINTLANIILIIFMLYSTAFIFLIYLVLSKSIK